MAPELSLKQSPVASPAVPTQAGAQLQGQSAWVGLGA